MNKNISALVINIYPMQPPEIRQKILSTKSKELGFIYELLQTGFGRLLNKIEIGSEVYVSQIFHSTYGLALLNIEVNEKEMHLISEHLLRMTEPTGGSFPAIPTKDWQRRPRIYSTFYFLATLNLLDLDHKFFGLNQEWSKRTVSWLLAAQKASGDNKGAFLEEDCPISITPENTFWALWSLEYLRQNGAIQSINNVVDDACDWIENVFLQKKELWSITRLFYALNTLRISKRLNRILMQGKERDIAKFVASLKMLEGSYREFPPSVKKGYREDIGAGHACLHSTLYAYLSLKMLNISKPTLEDVISAIDGFYTPKGFGTQVKIKEYEFGPPSTIFENFLSLVACLSAFPKDEN